MAGAQQYLVTVAPLLSGLPNSLQAAWEMVDHMQVTPLSALAAIGVEFEEGTQENRLETESVISSTSSYVIIPDVPDMEQ